MSTESSNYGNPDTRTRILQATWELVVRDGARMRIADVADQAGVSRQAVYLHFSDRTGLLVALVEHIDESLGLEELASEIYTASTGIVALQRMVRAVSTFSADIDPVAQVLESAQYQDPALAAAWRNRMMGRRQMCRGIAGRIADEGYLAEGWTVDTASELLYALTLPGVWRELALEGGWSSEQYADEVIRLLRRGMLG